MSTEQIAARPATSSIKAGMHSVLLIMLGLLFLLSTAARGHDPMVLAVHPYLPDAELLKRFTPLAEYLGKEIGLHMEIGIGKNYQDHIDSIGLGKVDIAFMGPASYVLLVERYGTKPLLVRLQSRGNAFFHGMVVTRRDSPVKSIADLKARRFAFGDPNSTMSSLLPQFMLLETGIRLAHLKNFEYLGSHDNVALSVLVGDFDAGGVKEEIYRKYKDRGLAVLATTPPIPEHVFVARDDLPPEIFDAVQTALFKLNDTEQGRSILQRIKGKTAEVAPAKDSDYDKLRHIMQRLHKIDGK